MLGPILGSRVEQRDLLARIGINARLFRSFVQGAGDARERKVVFGCRPGRGAGHGVVDVKGGFLSRLRQPAILAPLTCSTDHRSADCSSACICGENSSLIRVAGNHAGSGASNDPF